MKILINYDQDDLWCIECKERINIGEKYVEIIEEYGGEKIPKTYHLDCAPSEEESEDEDIFIIPTDNDPIDNNSKE